MTAKEKFLTLKQTAEMLKVSQNDVVTFVDQGVLTAYKIGGEYLRFRPEHISAFQQRQQAEKRRQGRPQDTKNEDVEESLELSYEASLPGSWQGKIADFFYFNDFYLLSAVLIAGMLYAIFRYHF